MRKLSYRELYDLVADIVSALLLVPIQPGDRVASYSSNCIVRLTFLIYTHRFTLFRKTSPAVWPQQLLARSGYVLDVTINSRILPIYFRIDKCGR